MLIPLVINIEGKEDFFISRKSISRCQINFTKRGYYFFKFCLAWVKNSNFLAKTEMPAKNCNNGDFNLKHPKN